MANYEEGILHEGQLLLETQEKIIACTKELNDVGINDMIEKLRQVEKKVSIVLTFFKAAMYTNISQEKDNQTNRPVI